IAVGGTNFPGKRIWEGGSKAWYDTIYILESVNSGWRVAGQKLPHALAYGVSATFGDRVICCGGENADQFYDSVFALRWHEGKIEISDLPKLPQPCATMCGAIAGQVLYVAGGVPSPIATRANHTFWALDLAKDRARQRWVELAAWPGPERHEALAASANG